MTLKSSKFGLLLSRRRHYRPRMGSLEYHLPTRRSQHSKHLHHAGPLKQPRQSTFQLPSLYHLKRKAIYSSLNMARRHYCAGFGEDSNRQVGMCETLDVESHQHAVCRWNTCSVVHGKNLAHALCAANEDGDGDSSETGKQKESDCARTTEFPERPPPEKKTCVLLQYQVR